MSTNVELPQPPEGMSFVAWTMRCGSTMVGTIDQEFPQTGMVYVRVFDGTIIPVASRNLFTPYGADVRSAYAHFRDLSCA